MATFQINEIREIPQHFGSHVGALPNLDGSSSQTAITTSGTSQQSAAFASTTKFIIAEAVGGAVRVAGGANPTAATGSFYMAADRPYIFEVKAGHKIAVIDA